jgi:hypothetical protein
LTQALKRFILNGAMPNEAIADLGFAATLLAGERRLLELVAAGEPLSVVLDALCTIAERPAPK